MAIHTKTLTIDGRKFKKTYSDTGYIQKKGTNEVYTEAVDIVYEYEEIDAPAQDEITDEILN